MEVSPTQPLLLLGAEHSLYTGKLRSYLRWKRVAHEAATSTSETYLAVILPKVGWGVVPVCVTPDGVVLQDTSVVIDHFEALQPHVRPVMPRGSRQRAASAIIELFGDEFLKLAAMHYRWSFPEQRHFLR
jgi:hypothetical protein